MSSAPQRDPAIERFANLFYHSKVHYWGENKGFDRTKNKVKYKYSISTVPTAFGSFESHLLGVKNHLTYVPYDENFTCRWAAIDVDVYDKYGWLEELLKKAEKLGLIPVRSTSGGLHLYIFFSEPIDVPKVRDHLKVLLKELDLDPKTEIFPKQKDYKVNGNGIKLPCFGYLGKGSSKPGEVYSFLDKAYASFVKPEDLKTSQTVKPKQKKVKQEDSPKAARQRITEYLASIKEADENDIGSTDEEILKLVGYMVGKGYTDDDIFFEVTKVTKVAHGSAKDSFESFNDYLQDKIDRSRDSLKIDEGNTKKQNLILDRLVYLADSDKWFDTVKNKAYKDTSINTQFGHYFKKQTPTAFIRGRSDKKVVEDFCYEPSLYNPETSLIEKNKLFYINKYKPCGIEPIPGDIGLYEELIDHIFGSLAAKEVWEDWVSFNYQHPGKKIRWALLITSKEFQIGKGTLFRSIQETLGKDNTRKIDYREAIDKSKLFLTDRQIVLVDEMKSEGGFAEKESLLNTLKLIITEEEQSSRALFVDYKPIETCTNIILYSNFQDALSLPKNEVRYWVHNCYAPRLNDKFYSDYHKWLSGTGKNHLLHHWKTRPISEDFNPDGTAPKTEHLKTMSRLGDHPLVNQIRDRFEQQLEPFESDREVMSSLWLFEWCKRSGILGRSRLNEVSKALESIGAVNMGQCPIKTFERTHKPTLWIIRNYDHWKTKTLEEIGEHWFNDPLNNGRGIDLFGGKTEKQ